MNDQKTSDERLAEIKQRCSVFAPNKWELRIEEPKLFRGNMSGYFTHVDGIEVYRTAYHIRGLETLGNHECGAMEKPAADFVFHAKDDIPWLLDELAKTKDQLSSAIRQIDEEQAVAVQFQKKLDSLQVAATSLRQAQRAYMSDRGNEALGEVVGVKAKELDKVLQAPEIKP